MTTLRTFLILFPDHGITFAEDDYIQVLDNETGAHYRFNENNSLLLGGDPAPVTFTELLDSRVCYVEFNHLDGELEVYDK